jgi:hypothetical protein
MMNPHIATATGGDITVVDETALYLPSELVFVWAVAGPVLVGRSTQGFE